MAFQKTTNTSYGTRLKNSFGGVGTGFILLIAGILLLFWNEGRTVKTARMLKESQGVCVELGDISAVNPEMDGKMVHATGMAETDEILTDDLFGISQNAIRLSRTVEYYQWVEHESSTKRDKLGGGQETVTTYTYSKSWVPFPVDSQEFEDPDYRGIYNGPLMTCDDMTVQARNVRFGAYRLPESLVSQMSRRQEFTVTPDPEIIGQLNRQLLQIDTTARDTMVHVRGAVIYLGANPGAPNVGDVRISFEKVVPGEVSILAKVNGDTFEQYTAKNDYSMLRLRDGAVGMDSMFAQARSSNKTTGWFLRLLGFLLLLWGFRNIFNIITSILKVVPFLASIANLGVGLVSGVLALALWLIVVAIAWIVYRPVLGIILLAAAVALIIFLGKKGKEKEKEKAEA